MMRAASGQKRDEYFMEKFSESVRIRQSLPSSELERNTEDQLRLARLAIVRQFEGQPTFICEDHEWTCEELSLANAMLPRMEQLTLKGTAAYHIWRREAERKYLHFIMFHAATCSDYNAVGAAIRLHLTQLKNDGPLSKAASTVFLNVIGGSRIVPAVWTYDGVEEKVQLMVTERHSRRYSQGFRFPAWIDGVMNPIPDGQEWWTGRRGYD